MMFPALENLTYANPVVGFGFYSIGIRTECYFLNKDGSISNHGAETEVDLFNVSRFDQSLNPIKTMKVHFFGEKSGV